MALTQMRLSLRRNRMWGISLPDMAPFAGVVFLLVCFYMMTGKFKYGEEGLVTLEQLPKTSSWHCRIPENASIIISLTAKNKLSFAVTSPEIQVEAIRQVGLQHGIRFTPRQISELINMPYLKTNLQNLPRFLSAPSYHHSKFSEFKTLQPLSEQELVECIVAARKVAQTTQHIPSSTSLRIEADVSMTHVERLIDLLQTQGINQYELRTQFE